MIDTTELQDMLAAIKAQCRQWRPPRRDDAHLILKHYREAGDNIPAKTRSYRHEE